MSFCHNYVNFRSNHPHTRTKNENDSSTTNSKSTPFNITPIATMSMDPNSDQPSTKDHSIQNTDHAISDNHTPQTTNVTSNDHSSQTTTTKELHPSSYHEYAMVVTGTLCGTSTQSSSTDLDETDHLHFMVSQEEVSLVKISPADLSKLLAALVPGRIRSSLVLQYTSPVRGGGGMEIAKVIRILQKKVPQQLTAVVHLAQLHVEKLRIHPNLAIRQSNLSVQTAPYHHIPKLPYLPLHVPYLPLMKNGMKAISLPLHQTYLLFASSQKALLSPQTGQYGRQTPPSQTHGSPGEGQSNSQGTGENSGQSEEEGQGGGHTSDNTGGSSGGGGGGDDRRDCRKGDKGGHEKKEEDEEEREAEEVVGEKEGEAEKVVRGEGKGVEEHDAAELVEGEGEGEEGEVVEMVEDEMHVIKLGKPVMDGGHEPRQEQWCLPGLNLLPPACKSGNHSPHFLLTATIIPCPLAAAPVLPFPGKSSASMTQQTPHSLPHSNPVSSTPPSSVHSSDSTISVHEKFDELVTGVSIPVCLHTNLLKSSTPGGGESQPFQPSSSSDQVQSTMPFHSLASPYDHHLAIPVNIVSPIHDENTNSSNSDFEYTLILFN